MNLKNSLNPKASHGAENRSGDGMESRGATTRFRAGVEMKLLILGALLMSTVAQAEVMQGESVVFCSDLQPRSAHLLFEPIEVQSVCRANGSQTFEEGADYLIDSSGRITLTLHSRIPVLDYYGQKNDSAIYRFSDKSKRPFYSPGGTRKHADYDVVVTYTCAEDSLDQLIKGAWESKLTTALDKLRKKTPVNVTFFGDSITFGAQASSLGKGCTPFAPAYPMRVINALKAQYGYSDIHYANKAVGGKTSAWGLQEIGQVIDTHPDLVFIAFGMNDSSGNTPADVYKRNTESMMQAVRSANPNVSIVLVAEFSPNPDLVNANYDLRAEARDSLYDLYQRHDNVAVVDVGAVSRRIAAVKKFQDFSGNNINHPNDFLHQIYSDLILKTVLNSELK
jgi:lysophospholipase L1-like esterase